MKRNQRIITKKIGDKIMLLDPVAGEIRILNQTAGFIWKKLRLKMTPLEIAKQLPHTFDVSEKKAYRDVVTFIRSYVAADLLISSKK